MTTTLTARYYRRRARKHAAWLVRTGRMVAVPVGAWERAA